MKKEDLRKVEVFEREKYDWTQTKHLKYGYFHQWVTLTDSYDGGISSGVYGLVEDDEGGINYYSARLIKFLN